MIVMATRVEMVTMLEGFLTCNWKDWVKLPQQGEMVTPAQECVQRSGQSDTCTGLVPVDLVQYHLEIH